MASTVTSQSCPMVHKGEARLWDPVELWRTRWPKDSCAHSQPEWSPTSWMLSSPTIFHFRTQIQEWLRPHRASRPIYTVQMRIQHTCLHCTLRRPPGLSTLHRCRTSKACLH